MNPFFYKLTFFRIIKFFSCSFIIIILVLSLYNYDLLLNFLNQINNIIEFSNFALCETKEKSLNLEKEISISAKALGSLLKKNKLSLEELFILRERLHNARIDYISRFIDKSNMTDIQSLLVTTNSVILATIGLNLMVFLSILFFIDKIRKLFNIEFPSTFTILILIFLLVIFLFYLFRIS